ncbi:TPA: hypothetical protein ACKP6I_001032 [Pseudomonas aeruginosa]
MDLSRNRPMNFARRYTLLTLEVETPPLLKQKQISELDHTKQQIVAIRHRLSELDQAEIAHVTKQLLQDGGRHA